MAGFAVFSLKYPSLLQFDKNKNKTRIKHNLRTLYGVHNAPCDTTLREICDGVEPYALRPAFTKIIHTAQHEGALEEYKFLDAHLLSMDATGQFSSNHINCPHCCEKR